MLSNQPISYFKIAAKYYLLYSIDCFSPVIIQVANMTQEQMNEPAPITRNQIDYFPALLTTVSAEELGENESVISPKIKANKGIDTPLAMAAISPIVNNNLSLEVAYLNNAKNETFGSGS